jgi:hypothetical protein
MEQKKAGCGAHLKSVTISVFLAHKERRTLYYVTEGKVFLQLIIIPLQHTMIMYKSLEVKLHNCIKKGN